ncbi:cytochrome c [Paenibacillus sp. N5-1-1-5]|uniref:Cytochrome c n=1 Tax=Paenibacillus radicis (ex Xue et al. 2023) TaxID=2972489 RepID=A0ABT1YJW7_9BACL|nr:cytochrome c [Paenibacillus radicis (ex Xue et al. 2023)]
MAAKAEPLFKDNCMACHGDQLQGGAGPNISKVGERRTKEELIAKIQNGGKVMPSFKDAIKPEEVEALAAWLATKK